MTDVRAHGFPVPEVFDAGDGYLVMELVHGPTMLDDAIPFRIRRAARTLAELHERLHRLTAPPWLIREAPVPGDRILHRDLHPLNVLMAPDGPVVIDWANASRGAPEFDVADTWVLFACADPPVRPVEAVFAPGRPAGVPALVPARRRSGCDAAAIPRRSITVWGTPT